MESSSSSCANIIGGGTGEPPGVGGREKVRSAGDAFGMREGDKEFIGSAGLGVKGDSGAQVAELG